MKTSQVFEKIRFKLLSPESVFEIFLRTQYHRVQGFSFFNAWQRARAAKSYRAWRARQSALPSLNALLSPNQPKVTFLLPCELSQTELALATLQTIRAFKPLHWEVLLLYKGILTPALPVEITSDGRITLVNPDSQNLAEIYSRVTGQFIIHAHAGDLFFVGLLESFYQALENQEQAVIFYYDCETPIKGPVKYQPFFKPAAISPELLLSVNYLSRAFIRTEKAAQISALLDPTTDLAYLELELILRLIEGKAHTRHIPRVLVTQQDLPLYSDTSSKELICKHLARVGLSDAHYKESIQGARLTWQKTDPKVAIIIPSKNNRVLLSSLVESIRNNTDYPNYTISIVDNASDDPDVITYYHRLEQSRDIKIIQYDKPFNYSEAINLGVEKTDSDLVLFLNNDMKVIDPWWLRELAQWAIQPEIGIVGAKLLRANHTIQHAGIILGMNGFMGHLYLNAPEHYTGLLGSADWYRNFYAVTGACQMVRRELFNLVGGYDEKYRLVFGDVDFCLRIHDLGYRNLVTPFARLYHYEGKSRGYKSPIDDILWGYAQMAYRLSKDDPYFSPNLSYTPIPQCDISENGCDQRMINIQNRRLALQKTKNEK